MDSVYGKFNNPLRWAYQDYLDFSNRPISIIASYQYVKIDKILMYVGSPTQRIILSVFENWNEDG